MFDFNFSRNRRDFLRVGGLTAFGLSLPTSLQSQAIAQTRNSRRARSVILVYLGGGMSHHDSFDPKPDAIEEVRGKYKPIATNVPGLQIGELLPMMAQTMDKVCLHRGGSHNNDHHETATNWVMSGRFGSAFGDWPAMGAVAAHESGFPGTLPPYVSIPRNPSFTWELGKSAFLGGRYESFKAGDPNEANFRVRDVARAEPLAQVRLDRRKSMLQAVDGLSRQMDGMISWWPMINFSNVQPRWCCRARPVMPLPSMPKSRQCGTDMVVRLSARAACWLADWSNAVSRM